MSWEGVDLARLREARRLCLFAHYHQDAIVAGHVLHYLAALRAAGFTVLVLSTAPLPPTEADKLRAAGAELVLRANEGMDFGGWIEACTRLFPIAAELLLLANDSVYAPIGDLTAFVERLVATEADFYGALETLEIAPHLQSWFVLLRPAAYRSDAFAALMRRPMPVLADKLALVRRYEIGLTRDLVAAGLRYRAGFGMAGRGGIATALPYNPAYLLWREVIAAGVPFLKVDLLRLDMVRVGDLGDWRAVVSRRAPDMVAMIEADLARRGTVRRPGMLAIGRQRPIYWPEVRALVLADHRRGGGGVRLVLARATIALAWAPRWVAARAVGLGMRLRR